jgi:hypothetical protein
MSVSFFVSLPSTVLSSTCTLKKQTYFNLQMNNNEKTNKYFGLFGGII